MSHIKMDINTNITYVMLNIDIEADDIHERHLYKFNAYEFKHNFIINIDSMTGLKLKEDELKTFLVKHRIDVCSYPYSEKQLYEASTISFVSSMIYKVENITEVF